MSDKATIFDFTRMCKSQPTCRYCPLKNTQNNCDFSFKEVEELEETNRIILAWCKEHKSKTRQSEFLKIFPNASFYENEQLLDICPLSIDKNFENKNKCVEKWSSTNIYQSCQHCKKEYWLKEVE